MPQLPAALPGQLLQWYDENRRILPWREKPSPYRTWISEVMLQQTRVEAGIAYFERFTAALPDIPALAAVEEQQLLKLWEGLGYYSRARNLKKAAIQLMQEHNGQLPADFAALCRLPGLGEYSAGAIASIAFDIRVPAVDGNVLRVAARLMNDARNIEDTAVKKEFRQIVWEVLPQHRVGDFNQSLMELGALICLPNGRPLCESCPVRDLCQSCAAGTQLALPTRQKKPRRRKEEKTVLLLCRPGEVQITQRPADGLLASLWEFPTLPGLHTSAEVAELLSVPTEAVTPLGPATHIFTHIEWQMQGYRVELPPETPLRVRFHPRGGAFRKLSHSLGLCCLLKDPAVTRCRGSAPAKFPQGAGHGGRPRRSAPHRAPLRGARQPGQGPGRPPAGANPSYQPSFPVPRRTPPCHHSPAPIPGAAAAASCLP